MPTTVTPSLGHSPLFTQGGVGSTPGYDAIDLRRTLLVGALQEGAVESGAYKVTQRAASANMSVDIAASAGWCVVMGDAVGSQGLYPVPPHTAVINEAITAAHATLPRIDQVVLELQDNTHDSSGGNLARVRVIAGTPSSGATLDNRTGAAALPSSCMRLSDVLVGAAATSITNAAIRDRRTWARGGYFSTVDTTARSTSSTSYTNMAAALSWRMECSGSPLKLSIAGNVEQNTAGAYVALRWTADGSALSPTREVFHSLAASGRGSGFTFDIEVTPSAGSILLTPQFRVNAGTGQVRSDLYGTVFRIEEVVRQNASNS